MGVEMNARRSIWPAFLCALAGLAMIIGGMALPWVDGRNGTTLPWRALLPWDLAQTTSSMLTSIALPIVAAAAFCLLAVLVRVRGLAITLAFVALGLEIAWFASEAFRRSRPDLLVSQLEGGAWLALLGAVFLIAGAFLTPRWEPEVR
jgi:hypothetical protein